MSDIDKKPNAFTEFMKNAAATVVATTPLGMLPASGKREGFMHRIDMVHLGIGEGLMRVPTGTMDGVNWVAKKLGMGYKGSASDGGDKLVRKAFAKAGIESRSRIDEGTIKWGVAAGTVAVAAATAGAGAAAGAESVSLLSKFGRAVGLSKEAVASLETAKTAASVTSTAHKVVKIAAAPIKISTSV